MNCPAQEGTLYASICYTVANFMVGLGSQKITEFGSSQAKVREPRHDVPLNRDTPFRSFSRYRMVG